MAKLARPTPFPEPKQPWEEFPVTVTFALGVGETIAGYTVTAWDLTAGADATAEVIDEPNLSEAGGVVTVPVRGGTDGHQYKITVRATTDSTPVRKLEKDLLMPVKEQ